MKQRKAGDVFLYELLSGVGSGKSTEKGSTSQLLNDMPYLLMSHIIPSEDVVNQLLSAGINEAGMSGGVQWEPYILSAGEFPNLVMLLQKNNSKLEYIKPPDWVGNFDDWHVWVMEYRHGVPWQKHKELNDAYICIENKMLKAYEEGNDKEGERLHLQVIKLGNELADYTQQYLNFKK